MYVKTNLQSYQNMGRPDELDYYYNILFTVYMRSY